MHALHSMVSAGFLIHILVSASNAQAACPEPSTRAAVALPVTEALQGFADMDGERFEGARDRATAALACLGEPLSSPEAAAFHGLMALDAFLQQNDAAAVNSFRAAQAADSWYALPPDTVPEAHPIRVQFQVAESLTGSVPTALPDLSPDTINVDGTPATTAPTGLGHGFPYCCE